MSGLEIKLDAKDIERIERVMREAAERSHDVIRRAINWTGDRIKTRVVNALTKQTGLKRRTILKAVVPERANFSALAYHMRARGGNISLLYFKPRERGSGVVAYPWGTAHTYGNAFRRSGLPGHRRLSPKLHGNVFINVDGGKWGGKIEKVHSGLYIPRELVKGDTAAAFNGGVAALLPGRVEHELGAILGGHAS